MSGEQVPARVRRRRDAMDQPLPKYAPLHLDKRITTQILPQLGPLEPERLLNTKQTAVVLGTSKAWLEIARMKGSGPPYKRLGPRNIKYLVADLRAWLESRTFVRTSEYVKPKDAD